MNIGIFEQAELSVRAHPVKGDLADNWTHKGNQLFGRSKVVFFIHGYNVREDEARAAYTSVYAKLMDAGISADIQNFTCRFYWPGNESNGVVSTLSYPFQISKAKKASELLVDFILKAHRFNTTAEFFFIAHSMGCRLTLEAVKRAVQQEPAIKARINLIALMAAAVPVSMVEKESAPLYHAPLYTRSIEILFSPRDTVLRWAFPPGQSAAGEGFLPEAIGLHGNPRPRWPKEKTHDMGLRHGDYWYNKNAAGKLANALGKVTPRELAVREMVTRRVGEW